MIRLASANPQEQSTPDWSLSSLGMNFAAGYLEGLTTFDILKEEAPDTTPEYISRSLGSVLGFIGWLPTPGGLARLGLLSAGRTMKLLGNATHVAEGVEMIAKASKIKALSFSIPSFAGKMGAKGIERFFESSAAASVMKFTENIAGRQLMSQGAKEMTKSLITQSAFMGFASAAGARPLSFNPLEYFSAEDFRTRSEAFLQGVPFGLAQGLIANAITKRTMSKLGYASLAEMPKAKQDFVLKSMRAVTAGLTMAGYTAYTQDVPIEYTVYEGLLNGVFGYREMPYQIKEANRIVSKHFQNQNTVHNELIGKSKGDLKKYVISQGENPSDGVIAELDGIIEHYYGKEFAQTFIPEIYNPEVAKLLGTTVEDLQKIPPSEIASVLGRPELEQLKSLRTDMIKGIQEDEVAKRVENFRKTQGAEPTQEEIQTMQEDQYPNSCLQVAEMTPKLVEHIKETNSRVNVAMSNNQTFVEKQLAVNKALEETGVPRAQSNALLQVLYKTGMDELKIVTDANKVFYENKTSGNKQYMPVKEQIEKSLGYKLDESQNKNIRTLWQMYSNSVLSQELTYKNVGSGKLIFKPTHNKAGIDQREHRDRYNYEIEFNKDIVSIKDIEGGFGKGGAKKTLNLYEAWKDASWNDVSLNVNKLIHTIAKHGMNLIGNRKDDYHMMAEKKGDVLYDLESDTYHLDHKGKTYEINLKRGFEQIDQAENTSGSYDAYIGDRTKYVEDNSGKSYADTDPQLAKKLEGEYDEMSANHMLKWMALNRKNNLYDIFSSPGSTIRGAFPYTTRLQVLAGGGIALDPSVVGRTHAKGILIETRTGELLNAFGEGETVQKDGVDIYHSRMQPFFADAIGVDKTNAFFKPAIAVSLETGLHLRKEGAHQGTEANEKALTEAIGEYDFATFVGTAAKQPGRISTAFLDTDSNGKYIVTNKDGKRLTPEEIEMLKFDIPVESIRLNSGVNEANSNDQLHMIKQMLSNTGELKDHMYENYILPQFNGDAKTNEDFKNLKTGQEIDVDKVGIKELLATFWGQDFHKTTPQMLAFAKRMLSYELSKGDEIEGDGESQLIDQLQRIRTSVSLSIMGTGRDNLTAEFLRRPDIRDYMEQVMYKYISDRVQRPVWNGFGTNSRIAYGLSPVDAREFKLKYGRDFAQGDFMLGVEARNQIRNTPEELKSIIKKDKISLGELWDIYQKSSDNKLLEDYFSRTIAARSPQSDASGSRRLTFRGFNGPGWGATLHPMDMKYLDGADLDGDAVKLYMGFDKKFVDHIDQPHIKHRFSRFFSSPQERDMFFSATTDPKVRHTLGKTVKEFSPEDLKLVLETGKDSKGITYLEEFAMEKGHNPYLRGKENESQFNNLRRTYSMFSPSMVAEAGRQATVGKNNLGWGLANANRGRELGNFLRGEIKSSGIEKVISGGQTGVDRMGLEIAKSLGIKTGGTAPLGYRTENGNDISLKNFGLKEHSSRDWLPRTEENVKESDGTVYFATDKDSAGLIATRRYANAHKKPFLLNPSKEVMQEWIANNNIKTLNVAGNRGSKLSSETKQMVKSVLQGTLNARQITSSKTLEVEGGEYYLKAKSDPEEFNRTVWDIVNSCADAAKGKNPPVDPGTMRVIGGVLSVADVFTKNGKPADTQVFINYVKQKGMKVIPIVKQLGEVDNMLHLRDYDGNRRNLQDIFPMLKDAVAKARNRVGNTDLGSVWYRSAQLLSELEYNPSPTDHTNMITSDIYRRKMDAFIKSNTPIARMLMSALGRTGLNFNNSYILQTAIWKDIVAQYKGDPKELLDDFIKSGNYQESKAWDIAGHMQGKAHGTLENRQAELQGQLVETSIKGLMEDAKFWKDKRGVTYLTKDNESKTEVFDNLAEAEAFQKEKIENSNGKKTEKDYTIGRVRRTKGEVTKYVQELYMNDDIDMVSLAFVNDHMSQYIAKRLPKENLTDDAVYDLLEKDVRPFAREVSDMKDYIYETHEGIVNPYRVDETGMKHWLTADKRKETFKSWEEALRTVENKRASLDEDKKQLFDALWLSSLNFNDRSQREFRDAALKLANDPNNTEEVNKIKTQLITEANSEKFKTLRGKTALVTDLADPAMVKAYFKKYADFASVSAEDVGDVSNKRIADAMNISELTKNYPAFTMRDHQFDVINTRQETETHTNQSSSALKRLYIENYSKDHLGNIKDPEARAELNELRSRWKNLVKNNPEQIKDFELNFRDVMTKFGHVGFDVSNMTKLDFKLYLDYMEGRQYDPKEVPKVKQSFFFMKFGRISEAMQRYQKEVDKYKIQFLRPVLTADGPGMKMVQSVLSHFDVIKKFADAHSLSSNAMLDTELRTFNTHLGYTSILDKTYSGLGRKMVEIAAATRIESVHINRKPLEGKKNLFRENYDREQKNFEKIPDIQYHFTSPDGKTITMNKNQLLDYAENGIRKFTDEIASGLEHRPDDDKMLVYTGKFYGKQQIEGIDHEKSIDNILKHTAQVGGNPPDMSLKALYQLAAWKTLKDRSFDILTTSSGDIYFDSQMGPKQREAFDRALSDNINGYTFKEKIRFDDMTEAERNAVMDNLYPNGNIAGFDLTERLDKRGTSYWHHMTMNKKTVTGYLKEKYESLLKGLPAEDVKNVTYRLIKEVASSVNQEDNLTFGQEFSARLHDTDSDPLRSMHIHPNSILGELDVNNPCPEWELGPEAMLSAFQKVWKARYDIQFAITSKHIVDDMRKRNVFGEGTDINNQHLANFAERYTRQVLGYQDVTPPELGDGYNYGLKTNLLKFHSDSYWNKKITSIADTWFGNKIFPEYKQLAVIASQIKFKDDNERKKWIEQSKKNLSEKKVSWLSQSEAKWSLISLLTSAKTAVTNVTSAEIMTFINSGFDAYKRSFRLKDIQDEFGSDIIRNRGDLQTIFEGIGGYETQYLNEYGMDASISKATHQTVVNIMKQTAEKNWGDVQIRKEIQKAGLMDLFVNKASYFMKASERVARSHSMLAHYINARRTFRQAGFELDYNDPWIMQIAREGVASSQFLYSNAERPAFMASAMGKIFHRFQLYAYNSVEFRYNTLKAAQMAGIAPGSDDYRKFNRMMAADLFMFGMASIVPYSIFGSALQAPYNGLQNSLMYMFGTDQEKKRSFFSPLPYPANIVQPVIPPGLREIPQLFGLFCSEGPTVKKVGDAVASWMPFQRIAKDIGKTIDNPTMIIDNMTGIPFIRIPQVGRKIEEMTTFDNYLNRYRDRASLSNSKKIEKDINSYLEQYPSP